MTKLSSFSPIISARFGFSRAHELGTYLGVPIIHKRANATSLKYLVDRIRSKSQRVAPWSFSLVSRSTITKSALQVVPLYVMQSTTNPKGVCADMDRVRRNFLWGSTEGNIKVDLVNWDRVCTPK